MTDVEAARRRFDEALAAARRTAAGAAPAVPPVIPPPGPLTAGAGQGGRKRARSGVAAPVAAPDAAPDAAPVAAPGAGGGGGGGGGQPPDDGAGAESNVDTAAEELIEARRKQNDAWLRKRGKQVLVVLAFAAVLLAVLGWTSCPTRGTATACDDGLRWAQTLVPVVAIATLAGLSWLLRGSGGLRQYLIGKDGRFSTSATQAALWTLAISYALLHVVATNVTGDSGTEAFAHLEGPYLLLLGGPFAAAALARAAVGRATDDGELQKVSSPTASPKDLVTDDDGRGSIVDLQYLVFNLVALVYFVGRFADDPTRLPELPLELVGLTSLAALTYTTSKITERNAPTITSVVRHGGSGPIRPDDLIEIRGTNFVPPGAGSDVALAGVRVRFGTRSVRVRTARGATSVTSDKIVVTIPLDVAPGNVDVSVVTAAGLESDKFTVNVAAAGAS